MGTTTCKRKRATGLKYRENRICHASFYMEGHPLGDIPIVRSKSTDAEHSTSLVPVNSPSESYALVMESHAVERNVETESSEDSGHSVL